MGNISLHEPMGFNYCPENYVMGIDCNWKNNKPVNEKYWPIFKRLEDKTARAQLLFYKPMAFSLDIIHDTFNPVYNLLGVTIRDSVFAFRSFISNLNDDGLTLSFSDEYNSFILGYNHLYK